MKRKRGGGSVSPKRHKDPTDKNALFGRATTTIQRKKFFFGCEGPAEGKGRLTEDSVATAFANRVLPVPGGPKRSTPVAITKQPLTHTHPVLSQTPDER
jgi:hypothetical protein